MGVGIIQTKTVIAMATLQFYFRNIRINSNTGRMIRILEEITNVNTGYSKSIIEIERKKYYWNQE